MAVANVLLFMKNKQSPVFWNGWECFPKICCHKCNQVVTVCFPIFVLRHGLWTLCNFIFIIVAMTVGVQAGSLVVALGSSCLVAFRSRRSKCYITTWFTCAQRMRRNKKLWNQSSKSFRTEIVMIHSCFPSFLWCWVIWLIICYVLIFITYNVRPLVEKNLKSPDETCLSTSAPYELLRSGKRILKW